jgi:aspartate racemase
VHSLDFGEIRQCQIDGDWERAGKIMAASAAGLVGAGAQLVLLATNLMHKAAGAIEDAIPVPFLHIADAVGQEAGRLGARRLGLLGTSPVLEEQFYAERLARHSVEAVALACTELELAITAADSPVPLIATAYTHARAAADRALAA